MSDATFPLDRAQKGLDPVLPYVLFRGKDPLTGAAKSYRWSGTDVASTVWLDGRLRSFGNAKRALSSRSGLPQGSSFTLQVADVDHKVRNFLKNHFQKHVAGVEIETNAIRATDLKASNTPMVTQRGLVKDYNWDDETVTFQCVDQYTAQGNDKIPRRAVETAFGFSGPNIGQPEPIVLGPNDGGVGVRELNGPCPFMFVGDIQLFQNPDVSVTAGMYLLAGHSLTYSGIGGTPFVHFYVNGDLTDTITDGGSPSYFIQWFMPGGYGPLAGDYFLDAPLTIPLGNDRFLDFQASDGRIRRYTVFFVIWQTSLGTDVTDSVSVRNGQLVLSAEMTGADNIGDGTGTQITGVMPLYKHFLKQYGARTDGGYQTGVFATDYENFADGVTPKVDDAALTAADRGLTGGVCLNTIQNLRDVEAMFARSGFFNIGTNRKLQRTASAWNPAALPTFTMRESRDLGKLKGNGRVTQEFANVFPFSYFSRSTVGGRSLLLNGLAYDDASITDHDNVQTQSPESINLDLIRDPSVADSVMSLHSGMFGTEPEVVVFTDVGLHVYDEADVGSVGRFYHRGLISSPMTGRVESITFKNGPKVDLEVRDLHFNLDESEMVLGEWDLGGSYDDPILPDTVGTISPWRNPRPARVDWARVPLGYSLVFEVWTRRVTMGLFAPQSFVKPRVSGTNGVTTVDVDGTTTDTSTWTVQTITVDRPTGNGIWYYRLQGLVTGSSPVDAEHYMQAYGTLVA